MYPALSDSLRLSLAERAAGESRREGSTEEPSAPEADADSADTAKEQPDKEHNWRGGGGGRGVNRAESCRERDAPRRGKHRNASDPNRLTAHHNHEHKAVYVRGLHRAVRRSIASRADLLAGSQHCAMSCGATHER
ncbi:hypothetical protein RR46_03106 [Papilio xuthus]|uniref:Uncharacterized protein n=1 Tax=Papilio xuthus TaxID=66420 RepID=A0A194Q8B9_PAPXU|nr:hypothetical protein RR46_03106 [Papilio xuthus]